jgi:hypothetical protein
MKEYEYNLEGACKSHGENIDERVLLGVIAGSLLIGG